MFRNPSSAKYEQLKSAVNLLRGCFYLEGRDRAGTIQVRKNEEFALNNLILEILTEKKSYNLLPSEKEKLPKLLLQLYKRRVEIMNEILDLLGPKYDKSREAAKLAEYQRELIELMKDIENTQLKKAIETALNKKFIATPKYDYKTFARDDCQEVVVNSDPDPLKTEIFALNQLINKVNDKLSNQSFEEDNDTILRTYLFPLYQKQMSIYAHVLHEKRKTLTESEKNELRKKYDECQTNVNVFKSKKGCAIS